MDNLFSMFHKIIIAGSGLVTSMLPMNAPSHIINHVLPTPTVVSQDNITIDKTVSAMGKHVTIMLTLPKNGGTIDGVVSGDCQGTIDGTYTGKPGFTFNGKGQVNCTFGFLSLPADATFNGVLHPTQKTADINYELTSGSNFSKNGSVTVEYTE